MSEITASEVIRVIDPDNVREIFLTGASNVSRMGPYVNIIHTVTRPKAEAVFANRAEPVDFVVVARLLMDPEGARAFANSILAQLGETVARPAGVEAMN